MNIEQHITRKTDLLNNESLSAFSGFTAQQSHLAYEVFFNFIGKIKPKRILEIGTGTGGFTQFLKFCVDYHNLDTEILTYDIYTRSDYEILEKKGVKVKIKNIFSSDYKKIDSGVINYIQSEGTSLVLCDGGHKISEFNLISKYIKKDDFIMAHDYAKNEKHFVENVSYKIWNWLEIQESDIINVCNEYELIDYDGEEFNSVVWTCKRKQSSKVEFIKKEETPQPKKLTLVTGLWDIGRGGLSEGWSRGFDTYLQKLDTLLDVDCNLIVFGDETTRNFVMRKRNTSNTLFVVRDVSWFKENGFYDKIQKIRVNPEWIELAPWLKESTQAKLEMYNPLVMSKMFLLHDAKIFDPFNSEYLFWIDAGISNTVHIGYFTHDNVLDKLTKYINKFSFVCFPYDANNEIHGFEFDKINKLAGKTVKKVARGGFFGGPKDTISNINGIYYDLMNLTLSQELMGTEESIFSIMVYKHPEIIDYFEIEGNGLLGKFFEDLKNETLKVKSENEQNSNLDISKCSLYVMTFNSPNQFETLVNSFDEYDKNFLLKPKKYLLDNSTDESTYEKYSELCNKFNFEHIKKDNLGICGGRQFIAEHFDNSDSDFMFFFEDDMFFTSSKNDVCKNGFNRFVNNLFSKSLEITKKENFDFLKLNYTEFFGDNGTQWSWYNVPQNLREEYWPENPKLPEIGLDPNAPKTKYNKILSHKGVPYASGEIYYCNWPQIVTKNGNYKMFLETKWAHPFEQTWMSYIYQKTKKGEINPGLLLMTPTEHNRFEHYEKGLRKES